MKRLRYFYIWLRWRLHGVLSYPTCLYIDNFEGREIADNYSKWLDNNYEFKVYLTSHYPKEIRRETMWRYFIKMEGYNGK